MKQVCIAVLLAASLAACNGKQPDAVNINDTSSLNNPALNDKNQEIEMPGIGDTIITNEGAYVKVDPNEKVPEKVVTRSVRPTPVRSQPAPVASTPAPANTPAPAAGTANGSNTTASTDNTPAPAPVEEKKGWSNAAKGAVIGASTGAVAGAIISKKKGTGAIIGGILGAGGGYVIGKSKDKKAQRDSSK